MSGMALDNPLVREYLRELEAAFARLPAKQASELREQIIAHIADALPRDACDEQVATVLARLGSPADLAAETAAGATTDATAGAGLGGRRGDEASRPSRRAGRAWRNWRIWVAAGAIVAVVAVVASKLITAETAPPLTAGGAEAWWYAQDRARAVDTSADGADQSTVPIRSGHWQGFVIGLFNDSDLTQTVLGPAYGNGLPSAFVGAGPPQGIIGVSTPNREIDDGGGVYTGVKFVLPGVIPRTNSGPCGCCGSRTRAFKGDQSKEVMRWPYACELAGSPGPRSFPPTRGWYVESPSTGKYASSAPYCQ
jgi:hypothetical protein